MVQEEGLDTVDANRALGLPDDCREYSSVRNILQNLGIRSIRLMVSTTIIAAFTCISSDVGSDLASVCHCLIQLCLPASVFALRGMQISCANQRDGTS